MEFKLLLLLIHFIKYHHTIPVNSNSSSTTTRWTQAEPPFTPEPLFTVVQPDMNKFQTAHYGDYRYLDPHAVVYGIDDDFYKYYERNNTDNFTGDYDPANIHVIVNNEIAYRRYWSIYKNFYFAKHVYAPYFLEDGTSDNSWDDTHFYETFVTNIRKLHNYNEDMLTANFRINPFMHFTLEEFKNRYTGFLNATDDDAAAENYSLNITSYPATLDWSVFDNKPASQIIPPLKCNLSYLYAAVYTLELTVLKEFLNPNISMAQLSFQQAYDCSVPKIPCGKPGVPHNIFKGLIDAKEGILTLQPFDEPNYEHFARVYLQLDVYDCDYQIYNIENRVIAANVTKFNIITVDDELALLGAVVTFGPLCTAIHVSELVQFYRSGILLAEACDPDVEADTAVVLVGYGSSPDNIDYWIIKNTWGPYWGQNGFLFLERGKNACGIGKYVAYPTVERPTKQPEPYYTTDYQEINF